MPELPEVQTTVNELKPHVMGKKIASVDIIKAGNIAAPSAKEFAHRLAGRKIKGIRRRGKYLIFDLDNGQFLIVHLRMTGSLLWQKASEETGKFVRVIIHLTDGSAIHFRDPRRFGRMWLVDDEQSIVGKLGIDALDAAFTPAELAKTLSKRKIPVKTVLLDQTAIAGIGNMYADEALYKARIHPQRPANSLTKNEISRLHESIQTVLRQGIRNKGASTATYFRPGGTKGEAHLDFVVAHRKGAECPVCGGPIERITVGQRGTFFCPKCQKLKSKAPGKI